MDSKTVEIMTKHIDDWAKNHLSKPIIIPERIDLKSISSIRYLRELKKLGR